MRNHCQFFLICLTALTVVLFIGCRQNTTVPQHLTGVWKTSAPKFEDRCLEFTENMLIFCIGNGDKISYPIRKIKAEEENNGILYTFYYKDSEGEKWSLIFVYKPDSGGTIQLVNRAEIWKKIGQGEI